ncbi:hypothetical protein J2W51_001965 [Tardiphaga robiniae]|jgi:hypothetical protein|uniref:hypothetical protein n=1 Tax=Tardiphaga robiniae TaxID=943830 RepID=UPI0028650A72|nr:hypothetical protein [Tardiphaga robiniae]MDR6659423.1 hypothetical protein [Tardiphaga robiniae]
MKVIISKKELQREVLAEMRKRPGCETLEAVDVQFSDRRADTNWTLYAFTEGRIDPGALHSALEMTLNKLCHQYELRAPE